jgi:hypothetical protein
MLLLLMFERAAEPETLFAQPNVHSGIVSRRRESVMLYKKLKGRPFEAALQEEASNSHKLLRPKPAVWEIIHDAAIQVSPSAVIRRGDLTACAASHLVSPQSEVKRPCAGRSQMASG